MAIDARANGIEEELISGPGDDYEKFLAFVKTVEKAPGNPILNGLIWNYNVTLILI